MVVLQRAEDRQLVEKAGLVRLAAHGYIVVMQDVRGRYASDGEFTPSDQEFEDGYDSVQWAAGLPGSDGQVGMFGASYFGV